MGDSVCGASFGGSCGAQPRVEASATGGGSVDASAAGGGDVTTGGSTQPHLTFDIWDVEGLPTEVLDLRACGDADVQLLVIAGNPGAAPFYQPFMRSLHAKLGGRTHVTAISNLGMDGQGLTPPGRVFSLEEQIQHKVALLRQHFVGAGRPPLVILGHSIGAFMSIHAVHRLEAHHLGSSHATAHALDSVAAREWEGGADDEAPAGNGGDMQAQLVAELQRQGGQQGQQDQQQGRPLPHRGEEQERGEGKERNQRPPSNVVKQWKWDAMHQEVPGVESFFVEAQTHGFCVSAEQSDDLAARIEAVVIAAVQAASKL
ncbi:hypothetical protein CHLNCDRAFT_137997 [Chlorella variabilis]|uniref:Uncharacterized protein n=1 Tax=Chlorella variabilis TaxID=554065 RepID=E1Z510_CHLVA|nr:hypothetical protein CHLNCDRAFT_137997 [Chlorella variabilis]EFN59441.1 hypothetical protein CHLNCDRAFT_137997 [Chlorella variabilis]|eukprot:XP_005851543.1 hypothetical protein CHLNCDRAFT_137997 [Chlorella variabilis]